MLNLIKYEFIRKWRTLMMFLAFVLGMNTIVLYRLMRGTQSDIEQMGLLGMFFGVLLFVFFILYIIDVTKMYSRDINNKSGYMIFLTPNSGYKILGAKVLTGIVEGFLFLAVFLILATISFFGFYEQAIAELLSSEMFVAGMAELNLSTGEFLSFLTALLMTIFASVVTLILTIYAAISIRKSILAEHKYGVLLSFLVFLLLTWINGKFMGLVFGKLTGIEMFVNEINFINLHTLTQLFLGAALFILSAYLLEKRMDL